MTSLRTSAQGVIATLSVLLIAGFSTSAYSANRIEQDTWVPSDGNYRGSAPWVYSRTTVITEADGPFVAQAAFVANARDALDIYVRDGRGGQLISFRFATRAPDSPLLDAEMEVGRLYETPGYSVPRDGYAALSSYNTDGSFGMLPNSYDYWFQVFDLQVDSEDKVTAFAALVYSRTNNRWSVGELAGVARIWYNSDVTIPSVPEPSSLAFMTLGLLAVGAWASKRRYSVSLL
ncbi:MAG: PEP-CTERM sorting domain-containing protein [Burkholderiales bacterium]|nr:PEP-CTERM sorting domain-containing protein [Burkholderiales bacterium]